MSILSKTFKAGKLFVWESGAKPKLMELPEKIYKASVGVDHIVAIGESGYHINNVEIFTPSAQGPTENLVMEIRKIRISRKLLSISKSIT